MRKLLSGIAGAAFAFGAMVGNSASAANLDQLISSNFNGGNPEVGFEDLSVETIPNDDGDGLLEVGESLAGYANFESVTISGNIVGLGDSYGNSALIAVFSTTVTAAADDGDGGTDYTFGSPTVSVIEIPSGDLGFDPVQFPAQSAATLAALAAGGNEVLRFGFTGDGSEIWTANANTTDTTDVGLTVDFDANLSLLVNNLNTTLVQQPRTAAQSPDGGTTEAFLTGNAFVNNVNNADFPVRNDADLFIALIPEPATATLGLLALGGLAMRRRRH